MGFLAFFQDYFPYISIFYYFLRYFHIHVFLSLLIVFHYFFLKLFKSLVLSANPDLLEVLLPIIVKETDEVLEKTITPSLTVYFKRFVNFWSVFFAKLRKSKIYN